MSSKGAAWGIEIGAYALKALRLERDGQSVVVTDFAIIPHRKALTTPDVDPNELVRLSLGQFISQKPLEGEHLVMSVPGHSAFARFAKLPPVEPKKVPDIVRFEAVQQIPFPIEQVEWDYQTFVSDDSPEVEVGIFAITRERVQQRLDLYAELGVSPEVMTLSPVAVYNAMAFDHRLAEAGGPVVYLDIGTSATDVIVAAQGRCWIRTFPLGGTHFTEAIAAAFKLSYPKAEKLKLEAATSKYAKQIMQAMRPVFSDLLQDLQRSIGFYQTAHPEQELKNMVGLGSTFKIPGLRKFLGQQLQLHVQRLDEYRTISVGGREAAAFAEGAVNMATAYGLALQGVGLGVISANLVPMRIRREQVWHSKSRWFAAAAALTLVGGAMMLWRPLTERQVLQPTIPPVVENVLRQGKAYKTQFDELRGKSNVGFTSLNMGRLIDDRHVWPYLAEDVATALASTDPQPDLLGGDPEAAAAIAARERRLVALTHLEGAYQPPAASGQPRRVNVLMNVRLSHDEPDKFVNQTIVRWLRENAEPAGERAAVPYRIVAESISINPEQLAVFTVDEKGGLQAVSSQAEPPRTGTPGGKPSSPLGPPGTQRPAAPGAAPPPPPQGSGAREGRRTPGSTPKRAAPGGAGMGAGGSPAGSGTPTAPTPPAWRPGESTQPEAQRSTPVDEMAPIPPRPPLHQAGDRVYTLPVTFTIELIDPARPANPDRTAAGAAPQESAS
jgi:type IV pilus assembly protein PilM